MIETWSLGKTFRPPAWPLGLALRRLERPLRALHDVTLRIASGEVFGLLGPNGAGKSTFLRLLATLLLPSEGSASVAGHDLLKEADRVRKAVGVASGDERGFYWRLTGRENLEFFAGLQGYDGSLVRRRAAALLELVDLLPHARQIVARYSAGMRQRLGLARALLGDPAIVLLDEPTRSLDPLAAESMLAVIRRLARDEGKTVLLATHQLEEAAMVCDRVGILVNGMLRGMLAPAALGADGLARVYRAAVEGAHDTSLPAVGIP